MYTDYKENEMKTKESNVLVGLERFAIPYTLEAALIIASFLHRKIKDKGGRPYICHPLWVYGQIVAKGGNLDEQIVAILHDVYEDSAVTLEELSYWFTPTVCTAIDAMSKRDGETREEYINRVSTNDIARKVKKEDLRHNMDITRLKNRGNLTEKDLARLKVYSEEYHFLCGGQYNV